MKITKRDNKLITDMVKSGHFSYEVYEMLVEQNKQKSAQIIKEMGDKYICHPSNHVKKLKKPLKW